MNLTKEKRTAIVRFVKLSEDSTKYTMPITEIEFETENGIKLIWRLPIKKSTNTLKKVKSLGIQFVVTCQIAPKTYLIEQVRILG